MKTCMLTGTIMVLGLAAADAEPLHFVNQEFNPVYVAAAYQKDSSIAGIDGHELNDTMPLIITKGYTLVPGKSTIDIPAGIEQEIDGAKYAAHLMALRVILKLGDASDVLIGDGSKENASRYNLMVAPNNADFQFWVKAGTASVVPARIQQLKAKGINVELAVFKSISAFLNKQNKVQWYGVGSPGSGSNTQMRLFYDQRAPFAQTIIRVRNDSGITRTFQVQANTANSGWQSFTDEKSLKPGDVGTWAVGANVGQIQRANVNGVTFYNVKLLGKTFDGGIALSAGSNASGMQGAHRMFTANAQKIEELTFSYR